MLKYLPPTDRYMFMSDVIRLLNVMEYSLPNTLNLIVGDADKLMRIYMFHSSKKIDVSICVIKTTKT
jgi:hypothetical protein